MTKKVKKFNKDITRSRSFRDLVFYIKVTRVILVFFPLMLNAQDSLLSQNDKLSKREKWKILRQKTERDVDKGDISREDANKRYARFRARVSGQRVERKDPVLEGYFKRYGIEDIDNLKNRILDQGIPADQLDAVLGGMLRLAHSIKLDGINYKINPRFQVYFEERLGMTKSQIIKIEKIARDIVSEHID
tara:strand:+ start:188 stop:757 length:570 start_codon:yes stop_codon:yes gene_type:complete